MPRVITDRHSVIPILGEIFREYGYSGTSLSEITHRTGLGKGSLYHYFPNGKKEMAEAVLDDLATWFNENVFMVLHINKDRGVGIKNMFDAVNHYFDSGKRICLVGAFALDDTRDQFGSKLNAYFTTWTVLLTAALKRCGFDTKEAKETAEDIVTGIQGALVLARSRNDPTIFTRTLKRLKKRVADGCRE